MPPATKPTPDQRIAELEQQLALSDQGVSKLAQRCLALEQQLAVLEKHETYDNMTLFRLTLYLDCGLGFSEQDTLPAPVSAYSANNHTVSAIFELPREVQAIRIDPGELPCYITGLALSDERLEAVPNGALALDGDKTLFLNFDPQFYVGCPERLPAGTKLAVSYTYYPLQTGADDTVFHAMRRGIELVQARAPPPLPPPTNSGPWPRITASSWPARSAGPSTWKNSWKPPSPKKSISASATRRCCPAPAGS